MDSCGLICEKFVKIVNRTDISKNEMTLPSKFCLQYSNRLGASFDVILRNGYRLPVDFDKERGILKGLLCFFKDFHFKGGEMLVFEYYGRFDLNVYIIGTNLNEIEYPYIVHHLQTCHSQTVTLANGGWRFVFFVDPTATFVDEIKPPTEFINRCGCNFPVLPRFVMSNGRIFRGTYNAETCKITCLRNMCDIVEAANLKNFYMLLFAFDGGSVVNISVFDEQLLEVVFSGSPTAHGDNIASGFQITIQQCHMFEHCHALDISVEYTDLCNMWGRIDYIYVYCGGSAWRLEVRKSSNWKQTTIGDGWLEFKKCLGLNLGDVCVFNCSNKSYHHFAVRVIRN